MPNIMKQNLLELTYCLLYQFINKSTIRYCIRPLFILILSFIYHFGQRYFQKQLIRQNLNKYSLRDILKGQTQKLEITKVPSINIYNKIAFAYGLISHENYFLIQTSGGKISLKQNRGMS
ncbi:hypothetical protein pb186bvf_018778 [Paramecium bursaria]